MPKKTTAFSAKPLDEKPLKKTVKKATAPRRTVKKKKISKKTISKKKPAPRRVIKKVRPLPKESEIDKQLTSIYEDSRGHMPNMKQIKVKKAHPVLKFFFSLIIVGGLLLAIALWGKMLILPNSDKFSEDKVTLKIQGPQKLSLAATTTYLISYGNNQNSKLKNAVLTVQYPKGFLFNSSQPKAKNIGNTEWNLGTIQPNEKKIINITGLTYGEVNNPESWRVFLTYQPEKYQYQAKKVDTLKVELKKSPFSITASGPDKTSLNNDVEYTFKVSSKDKTQVGNLYVEPSWSTNFFITTSTPAIDKNNRWVLDTNTLATEWTFKVKGRYVSTTEKKATTKVSITTPLQKDVSTYQLVQSDLTTELEQSTLNLSLAINGKIKDFSARPGDNLIYTINLKNTSKDELKDVKVELEIDAPSFNRRSIMDWGNLKDEYDGDIIGTQLSADERRGEITWYKKFIPKLANLIPNDEVNINLTLPIRDIDKFDLTKLKTHEIKINTQATYKDKAGKTKLLSSNPIAITLNSDLQLEVRDTKSTSNGKEQHKVKWVLTNNFHELKNIKLEADVYGQSSWKLDGSAPAGKANFDSKNKKITWQIDKMPLAADTLALPFTITIDKKNPTQEILVSKVKVVAEDMVTKEKIELNGKELRLK